jgi:hypothetical protein
MRLRRMFALCVGLGCVSVGLLVCSASALATKITSRYPTWSQPAGGVTVHVSGEGFTGATEVLFGSSPATSFNVESDARLTAVAPPGEGTVEISIVSASGTATGWKFLYHAADGPEFGGCGRFDPHEAWIGYLRTGNCIEPLNEAAGYSFNPLIAPDANYGFTTASKPSAVLKLETKAKRLITCKAEHGIGMITGTKTVRGVVLTFTGCADSKLGACQSGLASAGEILTTELNGTLGMIKRELSAAKDKVGLELGPAAGAFASFECGGIPITVRGSVIAQIGANVDRVNSTVALGEAKGTQKPNRFEGGPLIQLEEQIGESAAYEQAGLDLTAIAGGHPQLEISSRF